MPERQKTMANDATISVGLRDQATGPLKSLGETVKKFAQDFKRATPHVEGATASILRFATGVAVGNLATLATRKILGELVQNFNGVIAASNKYANSMIGLSSVAGAFGESQNKARDAARSLADDGLLSVADAADGLKNLLGAGFNMEQAINLMNGFKDAAAFNRQGTLEFGQAIVGATQGIKNQNSIMVDNVGITKNLSIIMKEAGLSIDDLAKVSFDASIRQKLYNGLMREASVFQGDAARSAQTLAGAQARLNTQMFNLKATIGQVLAPAVSILIAGFSDFISMIQGGVIPNMNNVAKTLVYLATVFNNFASGMIRTGQLIVNVFSGIAKSVYAVVQAIQGNLSGALNSIKSAGKGLVTPFTDFFGDLERNSKRMQATFQKINKEGVGSFGNVFREAVDRTVDLVDEGAKKIAEALAKENRDFQQAIKDQVARFEESLKDMVIAHRDKTKKLKTDVEEENKDHKAKLKDRKDDFDQAMKDIEKRHKDKVDTISKQIIKEKEKIADEVDKINDKYKESLEQFKIAAQERLNHLKVQLDKEGAKGRLSNKEKIKMLEDMLEREKVALEDQKIFREKQIEDEKKEVEEKNKERLDDLKSELDDELEAVKETKKEKESAYNEETERIKTEHIKRLNALQTELDIETEIQKKHAEDFAKFQNAVAEDDIARLKRKFAEERVVMEREHQDRLNDIKRRGDEERATREANEVRTNQSNSQQFQQNLNEQTRQVSITTSEIQKAIESGGLRLDNPPPRPPPRPPQKNVFQQVVSGVGSFVSKAVSGIRGFFGFQHGGIVTKPTASIIGEAGPEVVLPLNNKRRTNELLSQAGISTGREITINMPVTVVSGEIDIDMIAERLSFKLSKEGLI